MYKKEKIIILGLGAQTKYAVDLILNSKKNINLLGLVTFNKSLSKFDEFFLKKYKIKNFGNYSNLNNFLKILNKNKAKGTFVCSSNLELKCKLIDELKKKKIKLFSFVSKLAYVSKSAEIGKNVIINPYAVIEPMSKIKDGCMIHSTSVIHHDSTIEKCTLIASGVKVCGWSTIGKLSKIYVGSCIPPSSKLPNYSILKAGKVYKSKKIIKIK